MCFPLIMLIYNQTSGENHQSSLYDETPVNCIATKGMFLSNKSCVGDVAQWQSLACSRPWVQSPVP
jgi:hypothetical protein